MKLNRLVISLLLISTLNAGNSSTKNRVLPLVEPIAVQDSNLFLYVAGGVSSVDVESHLSVGSTFMDGALDDSANVGEIGVGYRYNHNIFATLSAQRAMLDIADIDNFYVSVNYQLSDTTAKPYIGALIGYSQLTWSESPHLVVANEDLTSDGLMYGVQAGLEQELTENWTLFVKYQFIKYDHTIDIRSSSSTIEHNHGQNILIGGQYEF